MALERKMNILGEQVGASAPLELKTSPAESLLPL